MKLRIGTPEEAGMCPQRVQHFVNLAKEWVAREVNQTLVFLVARRGIIVAYEALGRYTPDLDAPPLEHDAIFPLASLTKPITATGIMMLVEDGRLSINRPVAEYIPEFVGEGKDRVMVHHLLTHTSGLRDQEINEYAEKKKGTVEIPPPAETQLLTIHERLFLGYDAPVWKPPGEEMSYFNYGYELLAEIVRRVSGRSVSDFMTERIFRPLGMDDSYYLVPPAVMHRIVKRDPNGVFADIDRREHVENPRGVGGGGAYSTAMDMAVFGQMFLNGGVYGDVRIVSPTKVETMTRNHIPGVFARYGEELFRDAEWGFGWNLKINKKAIGWGEPLQSPGTYSHGGAGGVVLWVDPGYELVGTYFPVSRYSWESGKHYCPVDLFINAVTAAVIDV